MTTDFPLLAARGERRIHAVPSALVPPAGAICHFGDGLTAVDPRTSTPPRRPRFFRSPPAERCGLCVRTAREAGAH